MNFKTNICIQILLCFTALSCGGDRNIDEDERYYRTTDPPTTEITSPALARCDWENWYESEEQILEPYVYFNSIDRKKLIDDKFVEVKLGKTCFESRGAGKCNIYCPPENLILISLKNQNEVINDNEFYTFKVKAKCVEFNGIECSQYSFIGSLHEHMRDIKIEFSESLKKEGDFSYRIFTTTEDVANLHTGDIWRYKTQRAPFFVSTTSTDRPYRIYAGLKEEDRGYRWSPFFLDLPYSLDGNILLPEYERIWNPVLEIRENEPVYINKYLLNHYDQKLINLYIKFEFNLYE